MFAPDIVSLQQFYDTPFGQDVRGLVCARLKALWPDAKEDVVLGIGHCAPYLEYLRGSAAGISIAMPAHQGAAYWPPSSHNLVYLVHEAELPLQENSVNRILLLHSFEHTEHLNAMLDEMWRVLTPGGRALLVVPNRIGLWCHSSRSPFGYGRTFSHAQLRTLLQAHQFAVTHCDTALFMPPLPIRLLWRAARHVESVARVLCPFIGGVLVVEAQKQIYASVLQPAHVQRGYVPPVRAAAPVNALGQ
ncbi:MAG: methyltransferase domain-containing protein [Proteobacteria bacterium]|nr:methyltransferase domain-containing protein [Pseudomonadota bacterium]